MDSAGGGCRFWDGLSGVLVEDNSSDSACRTAIDSDSTGTLPVESETTQRIASYRSNYTQRNPFRRNPCNWKPADKMDRNKTETA